MDLVWEKQLSVGNAVIDSDHKNLIGMVNNIAHAIGVGDCHALAQAFELIESWLCIHFVNEEHIARAIEFNFSKHKLAQQLSLKELQRLRGELTTKDGMRIDDAVDNFPRALQNWLIDGHIINMDMFMRPALRTLDYEFWPSWIEGETNHTAGRTANLYLQHFDTLTP